jgi:hypothetical protein
MNLFKEPDKSTLIVYRKLRIKLFSNQIKDNKYLAI